MGVFWSFVEGYLIQIIVCAFVFMFFRHCPHFRHHLCEGGLLPPVSALETSYPDESYPAAAAAATGAVGAKRGVTGGALAHGALEISDINLQYFCNGWTRMFLVLLAE